MKYDLGDCLLYERLKEIGMTPQELADKLGWHVQQVSDYQAGRKRMSLATAISVADTIECDVRKIYKLIPIKVSERRRRQTKKNS